MTDAPTTELGTPGGLWPITMPGIGEPGYLVQSTDQTVDLQQPAAAPIFDRMRREDGRIGSSLDAYLGPLVRTPVHLVGDDVRPMVMDFVRAQLGLDDKDTKGRTRRRRQGIVWREHVQMAALMLAHGFAVFEPVYDVGPASPDLVDRYPELKNRPLAHLAKLGPRPAATILEIRVDRNGGLLGIVQQPAAGGLDAAASTGTWIPVDRLVWYCHRREGADWTGRSILRPAYKHWKMRDAFMLLDAQASERNSMGIPVVTYEVDDPAGKNEALAVARAVRAGAEAGIAMPNGRTLSLVGVNGTLVDLLPKIEYHDRAAADAMLTNFLSLGHDNGARSLGETFVDQFERAVEACSKQLEDVTTEHVIRDLVEYNFGPDEPYPRLEYDPFSADAEPTTDALKTLADAGLLVADKPARTWVRKRYGIPNEAPSDPAHQPAPIVTVGADGAPVTVPPVGAPPAPPAGITPPQLVPAAAAARAAKLADADHVVQTPAGPLTDLEAATAAHAPASFLSDLAALNAEVLALYRADVPSW